MLPLHLTLKHASGAIAAALLLAACAGPGPSAPAGSASGASGAIRALDGVPLTPCTLHGDVPVTADVDALCGTLDVPENRAQPDGRNIGLRVAVVPALAATPRPDPFVVLAGGPGEVATQFFAWLPGHYAEIHATRDIVLVDQRGTGGSHAMTLAALPEIVGTPPRATIDARYAAWAKDAFAALDGDPRLYTTTVAADDLDDVRTALGYDQVDLYGTSYGGTLAQYYLRQHPDRVRVAVLDGSTPVDVPVLERIVVNSEAALDLVLERCAADPACSAAFPDLQGEWTALAKALAHGITSDVVDPSTGQRAVADLAGIWPSLHRALMTEATAARLPLAIHLAATGDFAAATDLIPSAVGGGPRGELLAMAAETRCSEGWAKFESNEVARLGDTSWAKPSEVGVAEAWETLCRALPKGRVPADDAAPVTTSVPILWLTGDGDPQDPPANLTAIPDQQPNARVVVMPAQEHVVGHLGCGPRVIAAFVEAGTADGLDTSCIARGADPRPTFQLP